MRTTRARAYRGGVSSIISCVLAFGCGGAGSDSDGAARDGNDGSETPAAMSMGSVESTAEPSGGATAVLPPAGIAAPEVILDTEPEPVPLSSEEMAMELTGDTACAAVEVVPEALEIEVPVEITVTTEYLAPVALYLLLDNSGSMDNPPDGAPADADTKWMQAVDALSLFAQDPGSEGIDVALQYFNQDGDGNAVPEDGPRCDGTQHGVPEVQMASLPDNAQAVVDSLNGAEPNGSTPTIGALSGGVAYCEQFQAEHPDEACIVVLVTDGQPRGCGLEDCTGGVPSDCVAVNSAELLTPIAEMGAAAGVRTFAVGMAGVTLEGFDLLNAIALAGGTDCSPDVAGAEACDVSTTGAQGLLEALTGIRDIVSVTETMTETMTVVETQALPCEWGVPEVPEGETFEPMLVNVTLSLDGAAPEYLGAVATEADCAGIESGWYYDNPVIPTTIHACPQSCTTIEAASDASVEILLGCAAVPARPPAAG